MSFNRLSVVALGVLFAMPANAVVMEPDAAIAAARAACGGISAELNEMKKMAGIGTALTGVGTATGAGAVVSGVVKKETDADAEQLSIQIESLKKQRDSLVDASVAPQLTSDLLAFRGEFITSYIARIKSEIDTMINDLQKQHDELTGKSKTLGNVRTGMAAGTAAVNVGGAIVASQNKADASLSDMVAKCTVAIKDVQDSIMQARVSGGNVAALEAIVAGCADVEFMDLTTINKRASGATWASVAGAVTGAGAAVTSGVANTDKIRNVNTETGADSDKEKNLNAAANVLSGGATIASGVATVFNATQIKAIKTASEIADKCQEALQ